VTTGEVIGNVSLEHKSNDAGRDRGRAAVGFGNFGSDEIAFHPKAHIIASARGEAIGPQVPQVTIARLSYSRGQ